MSNPQDRPIAQPRRRLNRTASTNSLGSVGSATGSTSPMPPFGFGSPPPSVSAVKPPVQPTFGTGFGASNPSGFNAPQQANNMNMGFQSGFSNKPITSPNAASTAVSPMGFGGFGNPSVPSSTPTSQPFSGFGSQTNTSTSSFGAFGSANTPTSNAGGFQSGFGSTSGGLFGGFGKSSEQPKIDNDNDSNMDSEENPPATTQTPLFSGFGSNKPQTSTPLFSLSTSTEQNKQTTPVFSGFSFGQPASSTNTTPAKSFGSTPASPFGGFKTTNSNEVKDVNPNKPSTGFSFGSSSKTTPSPFSGFGQSIPPATITEIDSSESDNDKNDNKLSTSTASTKPATDIAPPTLSFSTSSIKPTEDTSTKAGHDKPAAATIDKPAISFGSLNNTSVETKNTETSTTTTTTTGSAATLSKKSDIPPTFAGLRSASEVSSPSSVIANASSPAPIPLEASEKEETATKKTSATLTENAPEEEATPTTTSLFGQQQRKNSTASVTSDTSNQAVATTSLSPFASLTKEGDKSSESNKATATEGFSITKPSDAFEAEMEPKPVGSVEEDSDPENEATAEKKDDKKPAFLFGNPSTDKPAATSSSFSFNKTPATPTTDKPSPFSFSPLASDKAAASKPFSFSLNPATTADKSDASKPFVFGTAEPTNDKSLSFSFGASTDKPASFSFSTPAPTSSSGSGKKRDRDSDDDDNNNDKEQAHKKTFFDSGKSNSSTSSTTPVFSFNTASKDTPTNSSSFKFGRTPASKSDQSTVVPTFTFGKPASSASDKKDASNLVFTFGAPTEKDSEKKDTPKSFSFNSPSTTTTTTEKKNFSFGAPPSPDTTRTEDSKSKSTTATSAGTPTIAASTADTSKSMSSFGSAADSTLSLGGKSSTHKTNDTTSAKVDNAANSTTLIHGKSPLSKSTSLLTNETEKNTSVDTGKRVSFSLPDTSSTAATSASTSSFSLSSALAKSTEPPASVSLAFSKIKNTDSSNISTAASATLNLAPNTKKEDSSKSGIALQTTLKSTITDAGQITYKTRFWELPDDARNELALLAHFITEQTDKRNKIDQELSSYFGSTLKEMHTNALTMNDDTIILGEKLEVQSKALDHLILLNKQQRLNAASASNVQQQDFKNWRLRGATENWNFFTNAISNMEERVGQLSEAVSTVEESINGLQSEAQFIPQHVGTMLDQQRRMYLSLAGRVAEIHQETDRLVKRRKLNK